MKCPGIQITNDKNFITMVTSCSAVSVKTSVRPCATSMASPRVKLAGKQWSSHGTPALYSTTAASTTQKGTGGGGGGGGGGIKLMKDRATKR